MAVLTRRTEHSNSLDPLTTEERSHRMAMIRSSETKPERKVRSLLHQLGFRFRKNVKKLSGCPDIVLPRYRTVVFVHGCFWHRHSECSRGKAIPHNNQAYWVSKFQRNVKRDNENQKKLVSEGWKVLIVWGCELKKSPEDVINCLASEIKTQTGSLYI